MCVRLELLRLIEVIVCIYLLEKAVDLLFLLLQQIVEVPHLLFGQEALITILHPKGVLPAHNLLRVEALFQLLAPLRDDPHDCWRVQSQIPRVYLIAVKQLFRLLDLLPD